MTVGVRVVLLRGESDAQEVFLIKHTYLPGWQFPGGGVEPGETMRESAEREVQEETGMEFTQTPILHGVFLNASTSDRDHVGVFVCRDPAQVRPFKPDLEIADGQWFSCKHLPEDVTRGTRQRILEITGDLPMPERW